GHSQFNVVSLDSKVKSQMPILLSQPELRRRENLSIILQVSELIAGICIIVLVLLSPKSNNGLWSLITLSSFCVMIALILNSSVISDLLSIRYHQQNSPKLNGSTTYKKLVNGRRL